MRYMLIILISYVIGIIWGLYQNKFDIVPLFFIYLLIFLFLFVISIIMSKLPLIKSKNIDIKFIIVLFVLFFLGGVININIKDEKFHNLYNEGEIYFTGTIDYFVSETNYYNKFICKSDSNDKFLIYIPKSICIKENEIIQVNGDFKKPSVKRNKGGFDYSKYLYSQGIYGLIYVKESTIEIIGKSNNLIGYIRNNIFDVLGKMYPNEELRFSARYDYWRYFVYK